MTNKISTKIKCFWCHGSSNAGVHSKCWKVFSGWMLSDRNEVDRILIDDEKADEYQTNGQDYVDKQGRNVVQGKVMPTNKGSGVFE